MISYPKDISALKAMQHLCIMARFFSTRKDDADAVIKILDAMDYLFQLHYSKDDKTENFADALCDMIQSVPQCEEALRIYNSNSQTN